ncbi:Hypothetical predicted protein, partial [Pelobates cultripes]
QPRPSEEMTLSKLRAPALTQKSRGTTRPATDTYHAEPPWQLLSNTASIYSTAPLFTRITLDSNSETYKDTQGKHKPNADSGT